MCIISLSSITGCSAGEGKLTARVGHHLEKIKDIEYKRSLKKIDNILAAKKIMLHMKDIEKLQKRISEQEPIKELLTSFTNKWNTENKILESLRDGNQQFMSEVNAFFIRGFVRAKEGWKTLYPIFKP